MASGLSAHLFAAVVSIGSSSSQNKHFNSVRPLGLGVDTILFPQCKQRVTLSIASPPFPPCLCGETPEPNFRSCIFIFTFDSLQGAEQCSRLSIGLMQTYTLMANLTPEEQRITRLKLERHLAGMNADDKTLAVEGLRYLRGSDRVARRRMTREST